MGSVSEKTPLIAIVGETASGKSALAMELAFRFNGEIICADSRTVYKGMDIGTAKPSVEDQKRVPHHLLDVIKSDEVFTAADFKQQALLAIEEISSRGRLPILVGGTGLYVDSVLYDYQFSERGAERDSQNPRHLKKSSNIQPQQLRPNTLVIGLQPARQQLEERIQKRTKHMMANGLMAEAQALASQYGWEARGLNTIGYKEQQALLAGEQTAENVAEQITRNTLAYAKRQRTWFKRNKSIHWVVSSEQAGDIVQNFLSKAPSSS